jgi:hypothetical protein
LFNRADGRIPELKDLSTANTQGRIFEVLDIVLMVLVGRGRKTKPQGFKAWGLFPNKLG